jgi:hypothetical protein
LHFALSLETRRYQHGVGSTAGKEAPMKAELLSFLEAALQMSILLNIFMAGLSGFLVYQDRKAGRKQSLG